MITFLIGAGFKENNVTFVPISGLAGLNLIDRTSQPPELVEWYADSWYLKFRTTDDEKSKNALQCEPICLVEALENFKNPKMPINKPLRVCIYGYYNKLRHGNDTLYGDCLTVKVESGVLKRTDTLMLMPLSHKVTIRAIQIAEKDVPVACAGELCEVSLVNDFSKDLDPEYITAGHVLCDLNYPVH